LLQTTSGGEAASITFRPVANSCLETAKPDIGDKEDEK
jgi:hypothetical protein